MKFLNRQMFLDTINKWIRDGSNLISIDSDPLAETAVLKGRDGVKEVHIFFYDEDDYDESELEGTESEEPRSAAQTLVDATVENIQTARTQILDHMMANPGFLATFGSDFRVEFGEVTVYSNEPQGFDPLNVLKLRVEHNIVVRNAATEKSEETPEEHALVAKVRNLIKERNEALAHEDLKTFDEKNKVLKEHESELEFLGLRMTENGDLESV